MGDMLITLIKQGKQKNENGIVENTEQKREKVFARESFLSSAEFYGALQSNMKLAYKLNVLKSEYDGQDFAEVGGVVFKVVKRGEAKNPDYWTINLFEV